MSDLIAGMLLLSLLKREDMHLDKMNNTNPTKTRDEIRCSGRVESC
jgi:hypothetical protein